MTLDLKAKAERIAEDIIQNSESWWLGADEIVSLCKEVQDATRRECADLANHWMDRDGELTQSETFVTAEGIRNQILMLIDPLTPEKKEG